MIAFLLLFFRAKYKEMIVENPATNKYNETNQFPKKKKKMNQENNFMQKPHEIVEYIYG